MRSCPTCESTSLSWEFTLDAYPGAHLGRLTLRDVAAVYVLGCAECSATVATISARDSAVLAALDALNPGSGGHGGPYEVLPRVTVDEMDRFLGTLGLLTVERASTIERNGS